MIDYKDLFSEDTDKAKPYRHNYLESVLKVAESVAEERKNSRDSYISPEMLKADRAKYSADFKALLGSPLFDRRVKNDVQKMFVGVDGQGYIYRLVFNFEKDIKFCGLLFVPFDVKEKVPLVVAIHGGDGTPELMSDMYGDNYYSHITRRLLDRKAVVFCPQLLIWDGKKFGDRFDRFELDARYKSLGGSLTAFECECIMGALDHLINSDFIDGERVGITGLSYGGYYSIITAALDERIKAVYSSCVFNDRIKCSRPDFVYKDMADKFSDAETAALIYPRSLYIEAGKNDGFFGVNGAVSEYERLKKYYSDAPERLRFKVTDTGHKYDDTDEGIEFLFNGLE